MKRRAAKSSAKRSPRIERIDSNTPIGSNRVDHSGNGAAPPISAMWQSIEAARAGAYRNMMWFFPGLDTDRQFNKWTRDQYATKNVWAFNNMGPVRAIIDGLAIDEVDTALWPTATTSSKEFNKAVTDRFHEENKDPRTFDLRQVESFYTGQFLIRREVRLIGELFGQLVRPDDVIDPNSHVRISPPPRIGFLPGYQCKSDDKKKNDPNYREGIFYDPKTQAATRYDFAVKDAASRTGTEETFMPLDASNVLHFHDPFRVDQSRGISTLAPVTPKMFTMDDIGNSEAGSQIIRSRQAYSIETVGPEDSGAPMIKLPGEKSREVIDNPDGSKTVIRHIVAADGSELDVVTPPSGAKVKVLESSRSGALEVHAWVAREIALPSLYPPDWVLFLIGLRQGTDVRMLQNRVQKIARFFRSNQLEAQYADRYYTYWLWQRIKARLFDTVAGGVPVDWWMREWNHPADLSVDVGREGRLYDDRVMRGNMSPRDYHAKSGRHYSDVDNEDIEIAYERREKLIEAAKRHPNVDPVTYRDIWQPPAGSANVAATVGPGPDAPPNNGNQNPPDNPPSKK